ncbi:hypothetical protein ACIQU4_18110 [Streptomyces sp. NPDC090741]
MDLLLGRVVGSGGYGRDRVSQDVWSAVRMTDCCGLSCRDVAALGAGRID